MTILALIILALGIFPLSIAFALLPPARSQALSGALLLESSLLCTLAFNLTFFWQELWLVLSKAMSPGLNPVLYHNNHEWTGDAPYAELLQGTGAVATLMSGLVFLRVSVAPRESVGSWRLLAAWMAFQGLFQSFSQIAIGSLLPGNDVGRAFAFLHLGELGRVLILVFAVTSMAKAGTLLARSWPASRDAIGIDRGFMLALFVPAIISVFLLVPFRVPRDWIEVFLVPVVVHVLGVGWTSLGAVWVQSPASVSRTAGPALIAPAFTLLLVLAIFQLVLAPGIAF